MSDSIKAESRDVETVELDVSIIVPCRDESKHLRHFLDSLFQQDMEGIRWEAIIADGQSDEATQRILKEYTDQYIKLRTVENPGRIASTGLNAAIREARGNIVIRMDCHTEFQHDYVKRCLQVMQETGADNVGGPARTKSEGWIATAIAAAFHSPFSTGGAKFHDENYQGYVDTVVYGCWKRRTLEQLGLFDERLVRNQDDEFNLRMTRSGMTLWQSPSIVSWYRPRATFASLFRQYFQYGFWKIPVIRKHRLPGSWRHLIPGIFVLANLIAPLLLLLPLPKGIAIWMARAWEFGLLSYLVLCMVASVRAARSYGWDLLPVLPATFMVFHVSYGLGFLLGFGYWPLRSEGRMAPGSLFTGLNR